MSHLPPHSYHPQQQQQHAGYQSPPYSQQPPHGGSSTPVYQEQQYAQGGQPRQYHPTAPATNVPLGQPRQASPNYGQQQQPTDSGESDFFRSSFPTGATTQLGLQIGSQMINAGQDFVAKNISSYVSQGMLKTYFNVTNTYVLQKVMIILFPFRHKVWQRSVLRDTAGQPCGFQPPRHDVNSPDLYIPLMAAATYILLVGMILGLRNAFHPKQLGVTASGALVFIVCELVLVKLGAYLLSLNSDVFLLDMLAIIGYNFIPLIATMSVDLFLGRRAKWLTFLYCGLAMGFFMLRSLRYSFLPDSSSPLVVNQRRTRVLFLFGVVCVQILCSCLLLV